MSFINTMEGQNIIDATRRYLDYLEEHLENVRRAFQEVSEACETMMWVGDDYSWHTVRQEVINHDLSKFSAEEFTSYRRAFFPTNTEDKQELGDAWEHHKTCNHHHWETVENYLDIVHMVIDWTAMGYKFGDTAQQYYETHKDEIHIANDLIDFMYEIFEMLKEHRICTTGGSHLHI